MQESGYFDILFSIANKICTDPSLFPSGIDREEYLRVCGVILGISWFVPGYTDVNFGELNNSKGEALSLTADEIRLLSNIGSKLINTASSMHTGDDDGLLSNVTYCLTSAAWQIIFGTYDAVQQIVLAPFIAEALTRFSAFFDTVSIPNQAATQKSTTSAPVGNVTIQKPAAHGFKSVCIFVAICLTMMASYHLLVRSINMATISQAIPGFSALPMGNVFSTKIRFIDETKVFWVPNGERFHSTKKCPSLIRSRDIQFGMIETAFNQGKENPCFNCVGC